MAETEIKEATIESSVEVLGNNIKWLRAAIRKAPAALAKAERDLDRIEAKFAAVDMRKNGHLRIISLDMDLDFARFKMANLFDGI